MKERSTIFAQPSRGLYIRHVTIVLPAALLPSLITKAMARTIKTITGVPVVCITYDGTCGTKNNVIIPYLAYPRKQQIAVHKSKTG